MTVRSAAYDLQVAIFDRLQAALPNVRISEKTKKNTPPPYIELYDITIMQTVEIKGGNDLQRLRLTLRLFDETENSDWIKDTTDDILAALTETKLVLSNGFTLYHSNSCDISARGWSSVQFRFCNNTYLGLRSIQHYGE